MLIRSWRRKAPTVSSAKLASHTRRLATIVTCANCLLFALVLLFFLHTKDCAFILYIALSFACLLCVEALWVQYK